MENVASQDQNATLGRFMTFAHDQEQDPAIVAYTRELFARYTGPLADKALVQYMRAQARRFQYMSKGSNISYHQLQIVRSRRQWLLRLLSVSDRSLSHLRPFMARVIVEAHSAPVDGAEHGGAHARSAGDLTGAALATPHE